jgi:oligoribonuclease (3'-5' exoribonuclease)
MTDALLPTAPTLAKSDQNLVWLDCEMTGLDPEVDRLIEIAVIVTGSDLTPRIEGPVFAIHQSDEQLDKMDSWNKGTHRRSRNRKPRNNCSRSSRSTCREAARPCAATRSGRTGASS